MNSFYQEYKKLLITAFSSGTRAVPTRSDFSEPFIDNKHMREFRAACHRGYEKAQTKIVSMLEELEQTDDLSPDEKRRRELLLMKVADGIAYTLLGTELHVMRRLTLHYYPQKPDLKIIRNALRVALDMNSESRATFALLADLTTFIHVTDILRIDFRSGERSISLVELKSGKVNELLISALDKYEPTPDALEVLKADPEIAEKHRNQACRMLRQRIRIEQINDLLENDEGIDIQIEKPIRLSKEGIAMDTYDHLINDLLTVARSEKFAAASVQQCIHIGVGLDERPEIAEQKALFAARYSQNKVSQQPEYQAKLSEITQSMPKNEIYKTLNPAEVNIHNCSYYPITMWSLEPDNKMVLIRRELQIMIFFDIVGFLLLGDSLDLEMTLSGKKEAAKTCQEYGKRNVPLWGGRAIKIGDFMMFGGMLSRFLVDLSNPLTYLGSWDQIHLE